METLRNTIDTYETANVDKSESDKGIRVAQYHHCKFGEQFIGNVERFVEASDKDEQAYKVEAAKVLVAAYRGDTLDSEQAKLATNLEAAINAMSNDPNGIRVYEKLLKALREGKNIAHDTGLKGEDGKKIHFITTAYKTMKSAIKSAIERGETSLTDLTKEELRVGKAAVKARSVVTEETLNAELAKLIAKGDANEFIFNAETGRFEAK